MTVRVTSCTQKVSDITVNPCCYRYVQVFMTI